MKKKIVIALMGLGLMTLAMYLIKISQNTLISQTKIKVMNIIPKDFMPSLPLIKDFNLSPPQNTHTTKYVYINEGVPQKITPQNEEVASDGYIPSINNEEPITPITEFEDLTNEEAQPPSIEQEPQPTNEVVSQAEPTNEIKEEVASVEEIKTIPTQEQITNDNEVANTDTNNTIFEVVKEDIAPTTTKRKLSKKELLLRQMINHNTQTKAVYSHLNKPLTKDELDYTNLKNLKLDVMDKLRDLSRVITNNEIIPIILVNAVSSELEGKVSATIESDIYGFKPTTILIPKGSKAVGFYKPLGKIGEGRLPIIWSRIITPQGRILNLTKNYSADIMGRSGAIGEIDNKYFDRYGMALTISTFTNAMSLIATKNLGSNDAGQEVFRDYKDDITTITAEILKENLKIRPILSIKAGARLFISPTLDIYVPNPLKKKGADGEEIILELVKEKEKKT